MIGYVMLGTNDLEKAASFYDEILEMLEGKRLMENPQGIAWSKGGNWDQVGFSIGTPFNEEPATVGNGTMMGLQCKDEEQVKAVYAKAIELGALDEGEPGARSEMFYEAYFRDLDGNKLSVFCMKS